MSYIHTYNYVNVIATIHVCEDEDKFCDCVGVILINFVAATADDVRGGSGDCDGGWQRL